MITGRKPIKTPPAAFPEVIDEVVQEELAAAEQLGQIMQANSDERDLVNQLLGQVQMARSFARFADVVSLSKLKHIKETKMYRALAGKKVFDPDGNEIADVGTFDGFCQALGMSRSKVDEDLTNLAAFGEEAMKSLSAIGAGYRELRQYRRLPDDQKSALIEVAKLGDKESFIDLAEEIIAKQAKEKEALNKRIEETEQQLATAKEITRRRDQALNQKEEELAKLTVAKPIQTPELLAADRLRMINEARMKIEAEIDSGLRSQFTLLQGLFGDDEVPNHARLAQQQTLSAIIQAARVVAGDFGITLQAADLERPDLLWATEGAELFAEAVALDMAQDKTNGLGG